MPTSLIAAISSFACTFRPSLGMYPWFAKLFTTGQGLRESVGLGGEKFPLINGFEESDDIADVISFEVDLRGRNLDDRKENIEHSDSRGGLRMLNNLEMRHSFFYASPLSNVEPSWWQWPSTETKSSCLPRYF
jgi:hypothetical protein